MKLNETAAIAMSATYVVAWVVQRLATGLLIGCGAWVAFAVIGTKIVCQ